ncbi:MAG TPA: tRNA preQ1(34) S-adenosylmethionine ribosyltransferase-isomerase QueA [Candidatus Dormibacteraeota bacterium]|nr:tRNA preQ1(34) S-adenosylmethionine ribosyltransferase-isomerase QueA [Candidatus Dormibacteraeota bacterium]
MRTAEFDYELPPELIAQQPLAERDQSRLLVLRRTSGEISHEHFRDLPRHLRAGDVLVLNNSKVLPARLWGRNERTGGEFEALLLEENATNDWWAMVRPGKRAKAGTRIQFRTNRGDPSLVSATVMAHNEEGHRRLKFEGAPDIASALAELGEIPLPPYISRSDEKAGPERTALLENDNERYQTVFARQPGSVAAPTAGLHFTQAVLNEIRSEGVHVCFVTLHVGLGTFAPVKAEEVAEHRMHEERYEISTETADVVNAGKEEGRRVIAVGTTSLRVLESAAAKLQRAGIEPGPGRTRLFVYPPQKFAIVDGLVTNFHLPRSTLLMLVSAFASPGSTNGIERVLSAYKEAIQRRYRFFSYGDAMLLI